MTVRSAAFIIKWQSMEWNAFLALRSPLAMPAVCGIMWTIMRSPSEKTATLTSYKESNGKFAAVAYFSQEPIFGTNEYCRITLLRINL